MNNVLKHLLLFLAFSVSGCATVNKMPLDAKASGIDTTERSILIAKVTIKSEKGTSPQPHMCCVFVDEDNKTYSFSAPAVLRQTDHAGREYLVSFDSRPGKVTLDMVRFLTAAPPFFMATAELKFAQNLEVPVNSLVYLGSITAVITDKVSGDEPSAGPMLPLIDQAVAGFSTGMFVVDIADNFDSDMEEFQQKYPYLKGREVVKMVLPGWVHPDVRKRALSSAADTEHQPIVEAEPVHATP